MLNIMDRADFFSETYTQARERFKEAAQRVCGPVSVYRHPEVKAPDGAELAVDTAWIGPDNPTVVLLCISGVHGPEGFCGSAAQLQNLTSGVLRSLPQGVSVLFVHALNPFGFAYVTRYNENNVDINRNWVDFGKRPQTCDLYAEIHECLPPADIFNDHAFNETALALAGLLQKHGGLAMENALSMGQYHWPDGIGYGGECAQWSSLTLKTILDSLPKSVRHIAYLDWHSLIRSGGDEMIYLCFNHPDDSLFRRCRDWWGAENVDAEYVDKKWGGALAREGGRPQRRGVMMWGVQAHLAEKCDVAGGVVEFTDDPIDPIEQKLVDLKAMLISRHIVATRDVTSSSGRKLADQSKEFWTPSRLKWRESSLVLAESVFKRTLKGAGLWAAESRYS
ncbi:MAG: DUF2817 domain-containing protein [Pseudomonadota bacterium]